MTRPVVEYCLLDNHPGYLDRDGKIMGAVFDIKTSGAVVRFVTITDTKGRLDIRNGQSSRLEGCWLEGTGGTRVHGFGHRLIGHKVVGDGEIGIMTGDVEWNVASSRHSRAFGCELHHCSGPVIVGVGDYPLRAENTRVYAQLSGGVSWQRVEGPRDERSRSPEPVVTPVKLTEADVGVHWDL